MNNSNQKPLADNTPNYYNAFLYVSQCYAKFIESILYMFIIKRKVNIIQAESLKLSALF